MTPAQRIAAVLRSRGREVAPWEVEAWLEGYRLVCAESGRTPVRDCDMATAIERNAPLPTKLLYKAFDAVDDVLARKESP